MPEQPIPDPASAFYEVTAYANAYLDTGSGELELGARVYPSADEATQRAQRSAVRDGLTHVGTFPVTMRVPFTRVVR